MTFADVSTTLQEVRGAKREVDLLLREIEELEAEAEAIRAITYDRIRVQTSPTNRLEEAIVRIEERSEKLTRKIEEEQEKLDIVSGLIALCEKPEVREVLTRRYIWLQGSHLIARQMNYSERYVYKLITAGKAEISYQTGG